MGLASRVDLSAEVRGSGAGLGEVAREYGLDEGVEDDLGTTAIRLVGLCASIRRSGSTYEVWGSAIQRTRTNLKV
jgi:hypothetical protein